MKIYYKKRQYHPVELCCKILFSSLFLFYFIFLLLSLLLSSLGLMTVSTLPYRQHARFNLAANTTSPPPPCAYTPPLDPSQSVSIARPFKSVPNAGEPEADVALGSTGAEPPRHRHCRSRSRNLNFRPLQQTPPPVQPHVPPTTPRAATGGVSSLSNAPAIWYYISIYI